MEKEKKKSRKRKREIFVLKDIHWRIMKYQYAGYSAEKIARIIHKSSATVRKWIKHPKYVEAYNLYSDKMDQIESARFEYLRGIVNDQFEEILTSKSTSDAVKLRAIELFWKKEGKLVNEINVKGDLNVSEKSTKELEENVKKLREKLKQLVGGFTANTAAVTGN